MDLRVGISANNLIDRLHKSVTLKSAVPMRVAASTDSGVLINIPAAEPLTVTAAGGKLKLGQQFSRARNQALLTVSSSADITVGSLSRGGLPPRYSGSFELSAIGDRVRLVLITGLDTYVKGVLRSEMPANFQIEAIKAQAVAARTYGLHPRLSHSEEHFNVCDSFLHCQAFAGTTFSITPSEHRAIAETAGEILTYEGKPILALFSANAGGHTESYENSFSDPETGRFPAPAIPYLKGVPEGALPSGFPSTEALRALWQEPKPQTADAWSSEFRWKVNLTERDYEGHMHHVVEQLREDPQFAPFITAAPSGTFGHIKGFEITQRGISGVAMSMKVLTTTGDWIIQKELTIRSLFKSPEAKLTRLHSARIILDHKYDSLGLLSQLTIYGLGYGHGVGMQQTGAQGWALRGKSYRDILKHYYPGACVTQA